MKSGVSLQQMLTEVKRQSESKEDYLIAPNRLRMESYGKEMFLHLSDDSGTELIEPMTITGIAHRQIGTHLRIPAAYYDRMREERPDLLAYNANTWFKQENSQRMLRTLDGSARAYLSNRYRRIDNIDIAGVTLPILGGLPDITIEEVAIFPQGYAALMTETGLLQDEPSMLLMDLGGWTVDLMRIDNAIPVADTAHSLELGMIRCVDDIREQVRRETELSLTDAQIENMLGVCRACSDTRTRRTASMSPKSPCSSCGMWCRFANRAGASLTSLPGQAPPCWPLCRKAMRLSALKCRTPTSNAAPNG